MTLQQQGRLPVLREKKVKRRSNKKVLVVVFLFFSILLLVLFIHSPFSKIVSIDIEGAYFLSESDIGQALGVHIDDQFFTVSSSELEQRVKQLEIIEAVVVTKAFPGRIKVEVTEYSEVAYLINQSGDQLAILANGAEVPIGLHQLQYNKPLLTGWHADDPVKIELSEVLATISPVLLDDISEIKPFPSLSYPDRIKLYTRSYFEVITAVEYLEDKLSYMDKVIDELRGRDIHSGILTMLLADTHAPFEGEESDGEEGLEDDIEHE